MAWRRYGLAAAAIPLAVLLQFTPALTHRFYKIYYLQSGSMSPTIGKNDRIVADMRWRGPLRRGAIVVFQGPDTVRVARIAGLPGDRIAMRHGVPILNGQAARQRTEGRTTFGSGEGPQSATLLAEQLPGETSTHRILDMGPSELDDTGEIVVPPRHLFVLGDNRDRAADSRVPADMFGVGMVPTDAILGRPVYLLWSGDHARIGTRLDR